MNFLRCANGSRMRLDPMYQNQLYHRHKMRKMSTKWVPMQSSNY